MQYREVGKTGLKSSAVGLGAEFLDGKPYSTVERTIHTALDAGVNIIDAFMPGTEIRRNIGQALKGRRDKVMIQGHICSVDLSKKYDISRDLKTCVYYFENLLRDLQTDYLDFGMFFFMDTQEALDAIQDNGILEYMLKQKDAGIIRHLGASSHNPVIAKKIVELGIIDVLMFSINAAYDLTDADKNHLAKCEYDFEKALDPRRMDLYKLCEKNGVGITAMKSLAAGKLLSLELTPFESEMTVVQCVHYALTRPAVSSVLVGCASPEEMLAALRYFDATDQEKDYSAIISKSRRSMKGSCVYCSHCQPCPADIDIAIVHRYLDVALIDESDIPYSIKTSYDALPFRGRDCIACGKCEERCPFDVPVITNMRKAEALLGK